MKTVFYIIFLIIAAAIDTYFCFTPVGAFIYDEFVFRETVEDNEPELGREYDITTDELKDWLGVGKTNKDESTEVDDDAYESNNNNYESDDESYENYASSQSSTQQEESNRYQEIERNYLCRYCNDYVVSNSSPSRYIKCGAPGGNGRPITHHDYVMVGEHGNDMWYCDRCNLRIRSEYRPDSYRVNRCNGKTGSHFWRKM